MDFRDTPEQAIWRQEVRTFLDNEKPKIDPEANPMEAMRRAGGYMKEWREKLSNKGWVAPAWPKEYGGASLSVMEQFIMNEEFAEARAMNVGGMGTSMIGPTIIIHGNEEQKKQHLGAILRGEVQWCQGYSEPGSGSDLASLQTRAVRDGDDFVINGQKIWTSGAHNADWMFMLARTDPDAPKHRGISFLLIDDIKNTPGLTIRPLINMANRHHFNEVFFEDVRIPANQVVGEVNRGWYHLAVALDFERSGIGAYAGGRKRVERLMKLAKDHPELAERRPSIRHELADRHIEVTTGTFLSYRVAHMQAKGLVPNHEASASKLFGSELSQRIGKTGMSMLGMLGQLRNGSKQEIMDIATPYLSSMSSTVAAGTSEIQRNIIATRGLGLPRG